MADTVYGKTVGGLLMDAAGNVYDAGAGLLNFARNNPESAGLVAGQFVPGAATQDFFGNYPNPTNPQEMLPSFGENLTQGNLLDAGAQAVGLIGDGFYAAAPITAGGSAIPGAALSAPRAAQLAKRLNASEKQAQDVIDLLKSGKADEVTEEMLEKSDPAYLANNYDLPMDAESRMARAREMGFDVESPLYHGTSDDFVAFDRESRGKSAPAQSAMRATWMTDNPDVALGYARLAEEGPIRDLLKQSRDAEIDGDFDLAEDLMRQAEALEFSDEAARGANILKVVAPKDLKTFDADGAEYDGGDYILMDMVKQAQNEKHKGLLIDNFIDNVDYSDMTDARHVGVFDPKNIRSVFARFDPRLQNLRNLNAGILGTAGAGVGAGLLMQQPEEEQQGLF